MSARLDWYASRYHALKAPRKLQWKPALGAVTLEVSVGASVLEVTASPAQAALLMHFKGQATWSLADLAAQVGTTRAAARKGALFWMNQGGQTVE